MRRISTLAAMSLVTLMSASGCSTTHSHEPTLLSADDSATSARVKTALLQDPKVKGSEINVDTYQGNVTLTGVIDDPDIERRAETIARDTPGVKSVKSAMQVAEAAETGSPR